jgi:acetyl-CoA C-acetyltransferase
VCLSGLNAIHLADLYIQSGEADIVVAGGMESMTNAPYLMPGARAGLRMGDGKVVDSMMFDGLFCAIDQLAMGAGTEKYAATAGLSRESQDALAALSHARAVKAQTDGLFNDEIVNVEIPQRKGDPKLFSVDEGVRAESTYDSLSGLRPAFDKAGNITAGNASQISDGGAAVIVASEAAAERLGITPLGRIIGYGQVAGPDASLLDQPANAINNALDRVGMKVSDLDLFELNEAFASVVLRYMKHLNIPHDKVNVCGGAIAMGHPLGATGAMITGIVLDELERTGKSTGLITLCAANGLGTATIIERV